MAQLHFMYILMGMPNIYSQPSGRPLRSRLRFVVDPWFMSVRPLSPIMIPLPIVLSARPRHLDCDGP